MLAWSVHYTGGYGTLLLYLMEEMASERLIDIPGHSPQGARSLWIKMYTDFPYSVQLSSQVNIFSFCLCEHICRLQLCSSNVPQPVTVTHCCVLYHLTPSAPSATAKHPLFLEISTQTFFQKKNSLIPLPRFSFLIKNLDSILFVPVVHNTQCFKIYFTIKFINFMSIGALPSHTSPHVCKIRKTVLGPWNWSYRWLGGYELPCGWWESNPVFCENNCAFPLSHFCSPHTC